MTAMTADRLPLVTIGIPTYNEAKFLGETITSVLAQTYPNLEIIIADNGSSDGTSDIAAEAARQHASIVHVRHPRNVGQHTNFNYLPHCASGTYFCWLAGHDVLDPTFVATCVAVLERDPAIVLAYPRTTNMREDGELTREKSRPFNIQGMPGWRRFAEVMWRVDCNYVYGMWRLEPMRRSRLFQLLPAPDRVFLAEMALKGTFAPADTMRFSRANRGDPQTEMQKRHRLMAYLYPGRTFTDAELAGNDLYAPTIRGFAEVAKNAGLSWWARMRALFSVWLCGVMKFHLFPGADALSALAKWALPTPLLHRLLRMMQ